MTTQATSTAGMLAEIGVTITQNAKATWSWSMANDKISLGPQGCYETPEQAAEGALLWLVEYARKGLLCHHVHVEPVDDDPMAPWLRAFEGGIGETE